MHARAPTSGPQRVHLRSRISLPRTADPAERHRSAMRGEQPGAHPRAAATDDGAGPDDVAAERSALLRPPAPSVTPPGSVSDAAARLRSHSAASFSIDGDGDHGYDAAGSLDSTSDDADGPQVKLPGVDVVAQLSLLVVAFIWGTYTPALRFLYQTAGPPSAAVLTGVRSTIQALTLVLPSLLVGATFTGLKTSCMSTSSCAVVAHRPGSKSCSRSFNTENLLLPLCSASATLSKTIKRLHV